MTMSDRQREVTRQRLDDYLSSLHVTLYLDWDLTKPDSREKCIEYLMKLFDNLDLRPFERQPRTVDIHPELSHRHQTDFHGRCIGCGEWIPR